MAKLLSKQLKITCSFCGEESTVENWDKNSISACDNRYERKIYRSLQKRTSYSKDLMYRCPICHVWCEGCTLKLENHPEIGGRKAHFIHNMTEDNDELHEVEKEIEFD